VYCEGLELPSQLFPMNIYKRQTNLVKPEELDFPILLIGCGGIGSWTLLALRKMGCSNVAVVEFDKGG